MKTFKDYLGEVLNENASAGASSSANVATCIGGPSPGSIGAGFDANGDYGIYATPQRKKKKSKTPPVLRR